ncbi:MAG: hypothetical protein UHS49_00955 [Faecalimonas sp.]|nr:hypothetical protein [Faecalimonas sp.]
MEKFSKLMAILLSMIVLVSVTGCSNNISNKGTTNNNNVLQNEMPMDSYDEYKLMNYLKSSKKPIILYNAKEISKDAEITDFYVIQDGKCQKYHYYFTNAKRLGDLSNMSDEEIIQMLDSDYEDSMEKAENKWQENIEQMIYIASIRKIAF